MNITKAVVVLAVAAASVASCRRKEAPPPPVATPSVTLSHDRVPLGSPVDITYRFEVAPDAPPFAEDYRVFVGVVDPDEELMWTDDHDPTCRPRSGSRGRSWNIPGRFSSRSTRTSGDASIHMGLYSPTTKKRLSLSGQDAGQRAYKVGEAPAVAADRERLHGLQGRVARPGDALGQRGGRMAVDQEDGNARVQESQEGQSVLSGHRQPEHDVPGRSTRPGHARAIQVVSDFMLPPARRSLHKIRCPPRSSARRIWPSCESASTRHLCRRCSRGRPTRIPASSVFGCFTRSSNRKNSDRHDKRIFVRASPGDGLP